MLKINETKKENVGARLRPCPNNGITLIALIITIIVMLILVAVTITVAVNGGLFNYAGKAGKETQNAINKEQELAGGKADINGKVYNSINEYINTLVNLESLANVAKEGDLVAYDPGNGTFDWNGYSSTNFASNSDGTQNNFVASDYSGGWNILKIKEESIYLISRQSVGDLYLYGDSAGADILRTTSWGCGWFTPEEGYVNILDKISLAYKNPNYANNGVALSTELLRNFFGTITYNDDVSGILGNTNFNYWLSGGDMWKYSWCNNIDIDCVSNNFLNKTMLMVDDGNEGDCRGVRVVVELKNGIQTSGKNADGEWVLVAE